MRHFLGSKADALVGHRACRLATVRLQANRYLRAGRRVLHGVLHEDAHGLLDEGGVAHHEARRHRQLARRCGCGLPHRMRVRDLALNAQAVRVRGIDHGGLLVHLAHDGTQVDCLHMQVVAPRVATRKEEELLHQLLHVRGFLLKGGDGLVEHLRVGLAPAVEHVYIALDDGDGRAKLVRCVVDELHLLELGLLHLAQKAVEGDLNAAQVGVAGRDVGRIHVGRVDGVPERLHLVGRRTSGVAHGVVGRGRAHGLRRQGQVVERFESPTDVTRQEYPVDKRKHLENHHGKRNRRRPGKTIAYGKRVALGHGTAHDIYQGRPVIGGQAVEPHLHAGRIHEMGCTAEEIIGQRLVALEYEPHHHGANDKHVKQDVFTQLAHPFVQRNAARDGTRQLGSAARPALLAAREKVVLRAAAPLLLRRVGTLAAGARRPLFVPTLRGRHSPLRARCSPA